MRFYDQTLHSGLRFYVERAGNVVDRPPRFSRIAGDDFHADKPARQLGQFSGSSNSAATLDRGASMSSSNLYFMVCLGERHLRWLRRLSF